MTPESIQIKEERYQALSQAHLIKEDVDVDSLFNETIINILDLEKIIQEYIDLKRTIQNLIKLPTKSILEFKILKLLDMKNGSIRPKDLENELPDARAKIYKVLNVLQADKRIERVEKGSYILTEKGRSYLYKKPMKVE